MTKKKVGNQIVKFDFQPLKVGSRFGFLTWRWCATYHWKNLDKGYNFFLDRISIEGLHTKLWPFKVAKVPTLGILGLPFGSPGTKCHFGVSLVAKHKVYYKGEGGRFPQVWAVVSLMNPCLPVMNSCTKKHLNYALTNFLLFGLCKSMWVIDACHSP
jgi:hypothetical protein